MQPNQNSPFGDQNSNQVPGGAQTQNQQPLGPPPTGDLPPVGPPANSMADLPPNPLMGPPPAAPATNQPPTPISNQPPVTQGAAQPAQPIGMPGNPPMPSQQSYPASSNMKKIILLIIGGLIVVSILGVLAIALLSRDDPTSSESSNNDLPGNSSQEAPSSLVTRTEESFDYSAQVPEAWSFRNDTDGTTIYTDESTDEASSVTLLFSNEPLITIPGFTLLTESDKDDFADGFIQGFESSFVSSAEEEGGLIRSIQTQVISVEGSELTFEFEFSGTNSIGNGINGVGRYLTNSSGDMYSVLVTALSDAWNASEAEFTGLVNSYRIK